MTGPAPKRSSQRRRENKVPVETALSDGQVRGPDLTGDHTELGRELYESVRRSGQSQFFEPSDWVVAKIAVETVDAFIRRPGAEMAKAILLFASQLLMTEAERRRIHLELERSATPEAEFDAAITRIDALQRRA